MSAWTLARPGGNIYQQLETVKRVDLLTQGVVHGTVCEHTIRDGDRQCSIIALALNILKLAC